MKILLIGTEGQVGWELKRSLTLLGDVTCLNQSQLNLCELDRVEQVVREISPDLLVNAAAYTAVDKAEEDSSVCQAVNGDAVGRMAKVMAELDGWLVHYSTDYVFDGTREGLYQETDPTCPVNAYGRTKLSGEEQITAAGCKHLILRVSWVFADRGSNFIKTMLKLGSSRDSLSIIDDQIGAPTSAEFITQCTVLAISRIMSADDQQSFSGIYHMVPAGETSWKGFAEYIFAVAADCGAELAIHNGSVSAVTTEQYGSPTARPLNSRLDISKFEKTFGIPLPDWKVFADKTIRELCEREYKA